MGTTVKLQLAEQQKQTGLLSKIAWEEIPKTTTGPTKVMLSFGFNSINGFGSYPKIVEP
jgi:hypothetical protein